MDSRVTSHSGDGLTTLPTPAPLVDYTQTSDVPNHLPDGSRKPASRIAQFRRPHRLSLRIAAAVFGLATISSVIAFALLDLRSLPLLVATPLLAGFAVYVITHSLLYRRMDLVRTTLQRIRSHDFEGLPADRESSGDELDGLINEAHETGAELEKEIHELRKIESYRRDFIGNLSHELKTPIFAIQGFAETLLDGAIDEASVNRSFVEKILRNADRLNNLSRDLTEITRIETGQLAMKIAPFDLGNAVREVAESLERMAADKGVTVSVMVPSDAARVLGDEHQIKVVIGNLIDNAIKYSNPGGHVEVVARQVSATDRVKISVVDDGIGIANEFLPRVTERFYRVDKSRSRSQGGTGLGLAIVKHVLAAHDQVLLKQSTPGRGSTFGFSLPVAG